jgi:Glutathione S-transferase, N-terminal domain
VKKAYGLGLLPDALTPQRKRVRELTGRNWVPVLVTDEGEVIQDSNRIVEWARANPVSGADREVGTA